MLHSERIVNSLDTIQDSKTTTYFVLMMVMFQNLVFMVVVVVDLVNVAMMLNYFWGCPSLKAIMDLIVDDK